MMIQYKNLQPFAFKHFDWMLAVVSWRGKAQGAKVEAFRDQSVPGHFSCFVLGSRARQDQHLAKDDPFQNIVQPSAFRHFDRMLALVPWRGKA